MRSEEKKRKGYEKGEKEGGKRAYFIKKKIKCGQENAWRNVSKDYGKTEGKKGATILLHTRDGQRHSAGGET